MVYSISIRAYNLCTIADIIIHLFLCLFHFTSLRSHLSHIHPSPLSPIKPLSLLHPLSCLLNLSSRSLLCSFSLTSLLPHSHLSINTLLSISLSPLIYLISHLSLLPCVSLSLTHTHPSLLSHICSSYNTYLS